MVLLAFEEASAPSRLFDLIVQDPFDLLHQETRRRHAQHDVAYANSPGMFPVSDPALLPGSLYNGTRSFDPSRFIALQGGGDGGPALQTVCQQKGIFDRLTCSFWSHQRRVSGDRE
jgi:hypothetical protein